jgi:hypothetical protein
MRGIHLERGPPDRKPITVELESNSYSVDWFHISRKVKMALQPAIRNSHTGFHEESRIMEWPLSDLPAWSYLDRIIIGPEAAEDRPIHPRRQRS